MRVGDQERPHRSEVEPEATGGRGEIRPCVDQQVVVDQGRRAAADMPAPALAGDPAVVAATPELGHPLGGGGPEKGHAHQSPPPAQRSPIMS